MSHPDYKNVGSPEAKVIEEVGELLQAMMKADRFGWFNHHPERPGRTNMDDVKYEMNDVVEAIEALEVKMRQARLEHFNT